MKSRPHRLALFGGTFDPVHLGHLEMVAQARRLADLDEVVFLPCARSPFKEAQPLFSSEDRLRMLDLSIEEKGWVTWARASRFEIDRPPPSYSWQTAAHFRDQAPPATELWWILGADQWEQIDQWAESEKLREWLRFLVVARQGSRTPERPGWRATFLEFDHPASATALREGRGSESWLPESVQSYLRTIGKNIAGEGSDS